MNCPRCDKQLISSRYEDIEIDKCSNCYGIWLDDGELEAIIKKRIKVFTKEELRSAVEHSFLGVPKGQRDIHLSCPKCLAPMNTINYAISSGIILDRCLNNCGIWFDKSELEKVQAYREYWEDNIKNNEKTFSKLLNSKTTNTNDKDFSLLFIISSVISNLFK